MIQRDYLIIGAGVAGASACQAIRKLDHKGSIALIGNETYLPYNRSTLSTSFLTDARVSPSKLLALSQDWYDKNKVELRLGTVATHLNVERRLVVLDTGQTIEFRKALLSTGSRPRRPSVAGATLGNIVYLRTIRDAMALREIIRSNMQIVVIGGGIVAVEVASSLVKMGCKVKLMSRDQYIWQQRIDLETAKWLTAYLERIGIDLMMQETINGFEGKTILKNIQTKSGDRFPAEVALVAIGSELNLRLVQNTPLSSPNGTPVTNTLETEEKGVFAAGDVALFPDTIFGGVRRTPYVLNAIEQGEIAGMNMTGKKRHRHEGIPRLHTQFRDLEFHFIGDFSMAPQSVEFEGDRTKKKFMALYYQGDKLMGALLCNQSPQQVAAVAGRFHKGSKR